MFSPPCTPTSINTKGSVSSPALTTHLVKSALWLMPRSISRIFSYVSCGRADGGVRAQKQLHSQSLPSNLSKRISEVDGYGSRSSDPGALSPTQAARRRGGD